jgi:retinol-binding protein 3
MKMRLAYGIGLMAGVLALACATESLTTQTKRQTVDALIDAMGEFYVFPDKAEEAAKKLRAQIAAGAYDEITDGKAFAERLTSELRAASPDAHLGVRYSATPLPQRQQRERPSPEEIAQQRRTTLATNVGIERVERLLGNIGYIEVRSFSNPELAARPIAAAMSFVAETDGLIIDLRRNGGGLPETVRILSSYLFAEKVHLNTLVWRDGSRQEFWTNESVAGPRYADRPVYVLVSRSTGSGAEEFAYNLKQLKRATIVGECTWGGANPGGMVRLNDHFEAFIPSGRAENPITGTNWEGVGVQPDVAAEPAKALRVAQEALLRARLEKEADPAERQRIEQALRALESAP